MRTLGGPATWLALFLAATGLVLVFVYRPALPDAHFDVVDLVEAGPLGFVRALHVWGSHALVLATFLHLFRLVLTGGYRPPRQGNWRLGLVLGAVVLALAVTGHLLPWDERAAALMAVLFGGVEPAVLLPAYALHVVVLPVVGGWLLVRHLRRAREDRGGE